MHQHSEALIANLQEVARHIRLDVLDMVYRRKAGHPGGSFSAADILATLYFHQMKIDPANPTCPERDRFLLSKGHAAAALYSVLAQRGFFPADDLIHWGQLKFHLQGHPDRLNFRRRNVFRLPGAWAVDCCRPGPGSAPGWTELSCLCLDERWGHAIRRCLGRGDDRGQVSGE